MALALGFPAPGFSAFRFPLSACRLPPAATPSDIRLHVVKHLFFLVGPARKIPVVSCGQYVRMTHKVGTASTHEFAGDLYDEQFASSCDG
ncbi:MAG: hypothetical protein WDN30_12945 [Pararobbsia sp.]